jgi:hypothetical protein
VARIIAITLLATLALRAEAQSSLSANSATNNVSANSLTLILGAPPTGKSTSTNPLPDDLPLIPEDVTLFKESMLWQHTLGVRTGAGYRDNVLLSPSNPQGSAFLADGLDFSLTRLPLDGWGVDFLASGDDERYLQNVPSDGTDFWLADLTVRRFLGDNWLVGFEATENYLDEIDFVDTTGGPEIAELQGNIIKMKPSVRRSLDTNWWVELDFPASREILDAPLDNIWKYGPQLQAGFAQDKRRELTLSYQIQEFDHDSWPALAADGAPIGAQTLSLVEQRAELRWHEVWDAGNHWSTESRMMFARDTDNGGGFFNFNEYSLSERIRYEAGRWDVTATLRGSYRDYPIQRTGLTEGPALNQTLLHATLHGEYRLKRWLKLYAEYDFERSLSDLPDIRYEANTVTAGLIWEFE